MQAYIFANLHKQILFVNPRFHDLREFFGSTYTLLQHRLDCAVRRLIQRRMVFRLEYQRRSISVRRRTDNRVQLSCFSAVLRLKSRCARRADATAITSAVRNRRRVRNRLAERE